MIYGVTKVPVASLMNKPEKNGELADETLYGMRVELLREADENWVEVRTHYQYTGWARKEDFLWDADRVSAWETAPKQVVIKAYADVMPLPQVEGMAIASMTRGGLVGNVGQPNEKGWVCVTLCDGEKGYMKESCLCRQQTSWDKTEEAALRQAVVASALLYLGVQYRWGGKSSLGIDCSGICSMAYMLNGVLIYRDAQIKEGFPMKEIPREQMKEGDLLFFPGHVALYIGGGRYIHATAARGSDGVVINSLNPQDGDFRKDLLERITMVGSIFAD